MNTRFVVVDRGLDTNVYKIPAHQTARLVNEIGKEYLEIFENFADAREAALLIVSRYDEASRLSEWRLTFQTYPRIESLKAGISELTEDRVGTFIS